MTFFRIVVSRLLLHYPALLFAAAYGITVYALWVGVDFGDHWDEPLQYDLVVKSYQYQLLLPHTYHYPSMIYWLDLVSVSDRLFAIFFHTVDKGMLLVAGSMSLEKPGELIKLPPHNLHEIPFDFRFFILRARLLAMLSFVIGGSMDFPFTPCR